MFSCKSKVRMTLTLLYLVDDVFSLLTENFARVKKEKQNKTQIISSHQGAVMRSKTTL